MKKKLKVSCPTCKKKVPWDQSPFRPFCSKRCRLLDLGEWASDRYRIPGQKVGPEELSSEDSKKKKKNKKKDED